MNQLQVESIKLDQYKNTTHSTADFGGDFWAADVAGKLFNRWCSYNDMAEAAGYENEERNAEANSAEHDYLAFLNEWEQSFQTFIVKVEIAEEST
ncbi:hypothetical protein PZC41_14270 [Staphylococcus aureus]|uniref:hypothetical protein n=1 Tax=Staphylococcus aureus TaxID=1280 RepID=UPI0023B0590F|nr:hypothetical protein [Staphylococcus aureus]MDE8535470.1 hypothetical protein [Staphylococcus aureus]